MAVKPIISETESELTTQDHIDQNTVDSIETILGKIIAATLPDNFYFSLLLFRSRGDKPGMTPVRAIICDGPAGETVTLLHHYADKIAADMAKIEKYRNEVAMTNAENEARDATKQ